MNAVLSTNHSVRVWRYLLPSLAFVVLTLVCSVAYASPNLIANGSFETPTVPVGGFTNFLTGSTGITGWTVVTYDLSFAVGNVFDPRGVYGTTSTVGVMINGASTGTFTNSCLTCTNTLTWQTFTTSFVASGPTTLVEFVNEDPVTDNSNGLDNVVLTGAAGPALPEPATLGLFGLGLAGVAGCRRRRPT